MLTYLSDDDNVFQSICSGACGYVLKKTPSSEILEAFSDAHQGGLPFRAKSRARSSTSFRRRSRT